MHLTHTRRFLRRICLIGALTLIASTSNAETGVSDKEIIVGQSITLQDGKNAYGVAAAQGARLYLDMINAAGGIHGRKIVLRVLDDDSKPSNAEANARKLATDGAFILFGSVEGGPSTAVAKVANELKLPFFGPMAGSPTLRQPFQPYVFPVRAEHREEFRALMTWGKSTGLKSVGFLHADTEVGLLHLENVKLIASELGMNVAVTIPFKGEVSDSQIDEMIRLISEKKPDMLLNHGSSGLYQKVVAKGKAQLLQTTFMAVNSGSTQIARTLGPLSAGMVFSQVVPNPWERKSAISREYQDALQNSGSKAEISYGALEGFLTAKALVTALRANGRNLSRSSFIKTLESSRFDLGGIDLRYAPGNHEGSRFVDLSMAGRDGRFVQ